MTVDPEDAPLDPAALRIQARLRRLILISGLTLGIGILAVLAAAIYRIMARPEAVPPVPAATLRAAASILPAGARLIAANADGSRIVLTYEHTGGTSLITVDPRNLAVTGRLDLFQNVGMIRRVLADDEKRCLETVVGERLEHLRRRDPRPVVESEDDFSILQEVVILEMLEAEPGTARRVDLDSARHRKRVGVRAFGGGRRSR